MRLSVLALCAAAAGALSTTAFSTAAWAEPDITGMWATVAKGEGRQGVGQGPGRPNAQFAGMTPEAMARNLEDVRINTANNRLIGEAHTKCWPTGMPGLMQPPFGIEFLQTKGRITILSEVSNLPRTIYLDEKTHPDSIIPGWNGHSIGHWEGDVLIVDTIGFNGRNHNVSEKTHITERIYLQGDHLIDDLIQDDPLTFVTPRHVRYEYERAKGQEASEVMEYVCEVDPANLVAFEQEQKAAGRASAFDPAWSAVAFSKPDAVAQKK